MNTLERLFKDFRAEFDTNARLRGGVWVIAAVLLFYLALVQSERVTVAYDSYEADESRLARAEALLERQDWPQLLTAERTANQALQKAFWQAETQGLAQARLQAALANIAGVLELRDVRIQPGLTQPVPDVPGVWRVQAPVQRQPRPGRPTTGVVRPGHPSDQTGDRPGGPGAREGAPGDDPFGLFRWPRCRVRLGHGGFRVAAWRRRRKSWRRRPNATELH